MIVNKEKNDRLSDFVALSLSSARISYKLVEPKAILQSVKNED